MLNNKIIYVEKCTSILILYALIANILINLAINYIINCNTKCKILKIMISLEAEKNKDS